MILVNPKEVKFESSTDMIDYVSKGLPPTKKNFDALVTMINDDDLYIEGSTFMNKQQFIDGLTRVYENNCRKRNAILIGAGVVVVAGVAGAIAYKKHVEDSEAAILNDTLIMLEEECSQLLDIAVAAHETK